MQIYVIRHGESEDDLDGRYGGAADFALLESGRDQARRSASVLTGRGLQIIYTSPLARARESAEIISRGLGGVLVEPDSNLRERNTFGVFSGHTRADVTRLFGYLTNQLEFTGTSCAPGGEEYDAFVARVSSAFRDIVTRANAAGYTTIGMVLHRRFTLALFTEVLRVGDDYEGDHGSVNVIEYQTPRLVPRDLLS